MIAECRDSLLSGTTRQSEKRSPSTVNRYIAILSHVFNIAIQEWQWIDENPVAKIRKPKESKGRDRYLSTDEINRLLPVCKASERPYLYLIVLIALHTGARRGEILDLTWQEVDFKLYLKYKPKCQLLW